MLLDSDAFIQILLTGSTGILKKLKAEYSVQSLVVEAVEAEVYRLASGRLSHIRPALDRTINSGTVRVLTENLLAHEKGTAIGTSLFNQADQLGWRLHLSIDRGEAYSHGAAMTLGVPVVTHDREAVNRLGLDGVRFTEPVLRLYDLIGFGVQIGLLNHPDCDKGETLC